MKREAEVDPLGCRTSGPPPCRSIGSPLPHPQATKQSSRPQATASTDSRPHRPSPRQPASGAAGQCLIENGFTARYALPYRRLKGERWQPVRTRDRLTVSTMWAVDVRRAATLSHTASVSTATHASPYTRQSCQHAATAQGLWRASAKPQARLLRRTPRHPSGSSDFKFVEVIRRCSRVAAIRGQPKAA
jgi:hypothetical protein